MQACSYAIKLAEEPTSLTDDVLEAAVTSMHSLDISLPVKIRCNLAERSASKLVEAIGAATEDELTPLLREFAAHLSCAKSAEDDESPIRPSYYQIVHDLVEELEASTSTITSHDELESLQQQYQESFEVGSLEFRNP